MSINCSKYDQCINKHNYKAALFMLQNENNTLFFDKYLSTLLNKTINLTTTTYTNNENDIKNLIDYIISNLKDLLNSNKLFSDLDIKNCKTKTDGWVTNQLLSLLISNNLFVNFYKNSKENQDDLNANIDYFTNNKDNVGCVGTYNSILENLKILYNKLTPNKPTTTPSPSPSPSSSNKRLTTVQIAGIASGGVLFLILLVVLIKILKNKKKRRRRKGMNNNNNNINNRLKRL
jgi:hypothetical protein